MENIELFTELMLTEHEVELLVVPLVELLTPLLVTRSAVLLDLILEEFTEVL